jgi:hypothetical protein
MNDIEELLRETFAARVADQPALTAPAERAIRAARTVRRRRPLLGGLAAVLAVLLAGAGIAAVPAGPPAPGPTPPVPTPSVTLGRLPGAVVVPGGRLVLPDRTTVALGGAVRPAYQVPAGWLAVGAADDTSGQWLKLVTPDGSVHPLLDGLVGVVVARDGTHLAWQTATLLETGHISGVRVYVDHSTPKAVDAFPIAMSDTAVVLGGTQTGGMIDRFDVWLPGRGEYTPTWDRTPRTLVQVSGVAQDGRSFLGLVPGAAPGSNDICLALLDPTRYLTATRTACGLGLGLGATRVSPDGHWLAAAARGNGFEATALIDLGTVFQRPAIAQRWPYQVGYWRDGATILTRQPDGAPLRLTVGQHDGGPVAMPGLPSGWDFDWVTPPDGATYPAG